jgi:multiple sugar transport system ATP-binding protein
LGITPLLCRRPGQLSGGECQRVAIGRAVVKEPDAFLFDEPLSHLDAPLRAALRRELAKLQRQLQTTMVYVTHDQVEALALGDRVAVMHAGRIQQIGSPAEVYQRPANRFVAEFLGSPTMNFLDGVLVARDGVLQVAFEDFHVTLADGPEERCAGQLGQRVTLGIRPQAIVAEPCADGGIPGSVTATVVLVQSLGVEAYVDVRRGRQELTARAAAGRPFRLGDIVQLTFDSRQCHLFDPATGRAVAGSST